MATIPGVCGFLSHTLRFSQEYRFTVKIVCDGCFCAVQTNGFGFGYYTCDQCGFKACARCASLNQGQTSNNVCQVQESSSGPTTVHSWSSWVQQQPSSNPPNQFASSATSNHSPASQQRSNSPSPFASSAATNHSEAQQQRSNPPNPFASSAATNYSQSQQQWSNLPNPFANLAFMNHSEARQQWSNLPNPFASSAATKNSQPQQQRSNPPNPFASSAATNHSQPQQQRSNLFNPFASSAAMNHSEARQQRSNPPNPFASSAATNHSQPQQQRSNLFNPFASSAAMNHSEARQQSSSLSNPFASSAATKNSQPQQQSSNLSNPFASSAATKNSQSQQQWSNLPNLFASSATTKNSQSQQQRSNLFNPFASSAAMNHSEARQQSSSLSNPFASSAATKNSQPQQQSSNLSNPFASSAATKNSQSQQQWSNLPNLFASSATTKNSQSQQQRTTTQGRPPNGRPGQARRTAEGRSGKQRTPDGPEVSHGSLQQKETVNATQSSPSSPWGNLHKVNDSGDHEQQKRAVNAAQSSHDEKQPVIPCAGSLGHELQFLQRSPYKRGLQAVCNMCNKAGSEDLYHCENCQFDSHKACAEIQEEVKVIFHQHPLHRDHMDDEEFTCSFCGGDTEADVRPWVYKCLTCPNFTVHARCAKYPESLKHDSHPHTLKLVQKPVICDGCCKSKRQGYHYRCERCDFDLHPSCAILPTEPLCRLNRTHRVKMEYMASETCHLCNSQHDKACWMYRCTVCDVCMHIDCFSLELSDSGEELSGSDEVEEDFSELYQKFVESMEDIGSQAKVEKVFKHVDSFKINTKARSSLARQHSVKSVLYPKTSTPAQSEVHILDDGFAKMSLGDSSRSVVLNRDAEEEERRRAVQAAKEQKAERRREKAAMRALQEKENVAWREEIASQMQNFANKLQNIQYHQQAGSSNVATAKQVAELQACMENWKASDAKRHQEQSKLLQERHQEQTKLLQERHYEYMSGLHEIIRTQVHSQTRAVPRLVLCSETMSNSRKLLTVLRVGLKGVRLDLLCEHAEQPHVVSGAPGCEINQKVAGDRWTSLQPFLAAGVQIVTLAVNFAGMGALNNVLPNLHQKVWDIHAVDLGEHAMPTGRNKLVFKPEPVAEESAADWLKFYLRDQNINIAETFKLHRVRYKSPVHLKGTVGWLCRDHLAKGMKDLVLDPFP